MKTDKEIRNDVLAELAWQPNVDETEIGVIVENGVVTLSGTVASYSKKTAAEQAVKNVKGVRAVAEDIEVKYGSDYKKSDKEIAKAAADALKWNYTVPHENILTQVENGVISLSGAVEWEYQKDAAKKAVQDLMGVKYVSNNISIKQAVKPIEVKQKITKAFERLADIDARNIDVIVNNHTVKLKGKVHSWQEKDEARRTAYYTPGVNKVENELEVINY